MPAKWVRVNRDWLYTPLGLLAGTTYGQAFDVNSSGAIVGFTSANTVGCVGRPVIWPTNSVTPLPLPGLSSGNCGWAYSINDVGQITGFASDSRGRSQAVLWLPRPAGGYSVLVLGRPKGTSYSDGRGLNEPAADGSGALAVEVVGASRASSGETQATLWRVRLP
jgi:uncharacterized membrane protein